MVGAKVMDAAGPVSDLQRQCREHAEKIGMSTLFTPIARLEVVQAMIVLASWGDTSWRPGGHAMRIAMDMALYRCLPLLAQSGMGSGKKGVQLKEDFHLVVGARIWLTVSSSFSLRGFAGIELRRVFSCTRWSLSASLDERSLLMGRMAFNLGRPTLFAGEESIRHSRAFLSHPLSVQNDSRLVAICELLTVRRECSAASSA